MFSAGRHTSSMRPLVRFGKPLRNEAKLPSFTCASNAEVRQFQISGPVEVAEPKPPWHHGAD